MRGWLLAGVMVAYGFTSGAPAGATTLLPGQLLSVADLPEGTAVDIDVVTTFGYFQYEAAPVGGVRQLVYYDTLASQVNHDAAGRAEVLYSLGFPGLGERPSLPGDPVVREVSFPSETRVSIAGFGKASVEVTAIPNLSSVGFPLVERIERSADGDVISFTGFSGENLGFSKWIALVVPDLSFVPSVATASFLDLEGNARTLVGDAPGPSAGASSVPEPASMGLLALSVTALMARRRRGG